MAYFNYFPTIGYDVRGEKNNRRIQNITNILVRIRKKLKVSNLAYFDKYAVLDGDTPEIIAYQLYDDSTLHWIILYGNYMTNPYYEWPMSYYDLDKFVKKKYPSNENGVHHYEDADGYEVDSDASGATAVSNFVYESKKNEINRTINVIKPQYITQIINEFKELI